MCCGSLSRSCVYVCIVYSCGHAHDTAHWCQFRGQLQEQAIAFPSFLRQDLCFAVCHRVPKAT